MSAGSRTTPDEGSVVGTLPRVVEAGQHLVLDRLELMQFDMTQAASRALLASLLTAAGFLLLLEALGIGAAAVVTLLGRVMPLPAAIMLVGGVGSGLGAIAVMIGMRRTRLEPELRMTGHSINGSHGGGEGRQ